MEVIRKKVNSLKNQLEETEQRAGTAEEELKKEQDRNAKVQVDCTLKLKVLEYRKKNYHFLSRCKMSFSI